MFLHQQVVGFGSGGGHDPLLNIITGLGLGTNLTLCLDAGDISSYDGTSQDWVDVSGAGNADEFHRGTEPGAGTDDPTFNGSAGALSKNEYFSSDGGDFFEYGAASETWMGGSTSGGLHHNNATFSCTAWVNPVAAAQHVIFGSSNASSSEIGIGFFMLADGRMNMTGGNGSTLLISLSSTFTYSVGDWVFVAVSLDEAGGAAGSHFVINGTAETFNGVYNGPVASASTNRLHIGSTGNEAAVLPNNAQIAEVAMWDTNLSAANIDTIYEASKGRFGV